MGTRPRGARRSTRGADGRLRSGRTLRGVSCAHALRQRPTVLEPRAPHRLPRPKALNRMHLQLSEGRTGLTGVTGPDPPTRARAWRARAPDARAVTPSRWPVRRRRPRPSAPRPLARRAVVPAAARPAVCDCDTPHMAAGEAPIARPFAGLPPRCEHDAPRGPLPRVTPGSPSQHPPRSEARAQRARLTGVDLVAVTGLSASIAQPILSAVGTDRPQCPTVTPCGAWVGVAPPHDLSGGRVWRSRPLTVVRRATPALRQAAPAVARAASAVGADCRALRARLGPPHATLAPAHQLARVGSHLVQSRQPCTDASAVTEERTRRERALQPRSRRAHTLGYPFTPVA